MYHFIFTSNTYLYNGFCHLLRECQPKSKICIIDIESFRSLHELVRTIMMSDVGDDIAFFPIQGNGIYSRLLSSITCFHRDDKLTDIGHQLVYSGGRSYKEVMDCIQTSQKFKMMNGKDIYLSGGNSIYDSSLRMGINTKTHYSRTQAIAHKLGLRNLMQVRYFFQNEKICLSCTQDRTMIAHLVKRINRSDADNF